MRKLRFFISLILSAGMVVALNVRIGTIPPLGKLFDPFHGFWQNAEKNAPETPGDLSFDQLSGKVVIHFEDHLVPHFFASNEYDLYFAQGYLTAYYRLWQMDFLMLVAAGRVGEILGEGALDFDRLQRRKGLMYGAENSLKSLEANKEYYAHVKAYSDGVNAFISQLSYKTLPVEFKLLDYRPDTWSPLKSVLLLKYMADDLSGSDEDLENTNAVILFGKERFEFLLPDYPLEQDPVIPPGTKWNFKPAPVVTPEGFEITRKFEKKTIPDPEKGLGSNNWAVSGSRTSSGHAILCNDPHLQLGFPSIWFVQQLTAPGLNVYGATIPGLPGVLLGLNDSVAWGLTNSPRDVRDWYEITFKDEEKNEYLYDGKWLKSQKRVEPINLRGADPYIDTVVYTHYGPVVYDHTFSGDSGRIHFALRWMAHQPSLELMTVYLFDRAKNLEDMRAAARFFECPPQNVAMATRAGDIAIMVEGKFPLKWKDQGKYLMDGSDPKYEWQGFIPKEHNAFIANPERGFISSANQHPFDPTYPYWYYNDSEEYFRNRRINKILTDLKTIDPDDLKKLQNDNYYLLAAEILPVLLDTLKPDPDDETEQAMFENLKKWNYYAHPDLTGPSYFQVWFHYLEKLVWDEFDQEIDLPWPDEYNTSVLLRYFPEDSIFDDRSTPEFENWVDMAGRSFTLGADSIDNWKKQYRSEPVWFKFKNTRIRHLARLDPFSMYEVPVGGYGHIVNAAGRTAGPSWRLVAEMGEQINAWGIYPGGQSGNPGSYYYRNFVDPWAKGEYFQIRFLSSEEEGNKLAKGKKVVFDKSEGW